MHGARRPIPLDRRGARSAPTQARSAIRSSSSDGHSAPYPPLVRRSTPTGIVIRDAAVGSSLMPSHRVKKDDPEEDE
jgi:hypothetical protein